MYTTSDQGTGIDFGAFATPPFVADPQGNSLPPGFETTPQAVSTPPPVTTGAGWWDTIKNDAAGAVGWAEDEAKNAYGGVKNVASTVYGDISSGVGTVYDDVARPVESALTATYWYTIFAVVVLGGVIYFAGKSGALRISGI